MEIDGRVMDVVTFADVKPGDTVLCQTFYRVVTSVHTYAAGEPRTGPVKLDYPAVELRTEYGSRWGAPGVAMNVYREKA